MSFQSVRDFPYGTPPTNVASHFVEYAGAWSIKQQFSWFAAVSIVEIWNAILTVLTLLTLTRRPTNRPSPLPLPSSMFCAVCVIIPIPPPPAVVVVCLPRSAGTLAGNRHRGYLEHDRPRSSRCCSRYRCRAGVDHHAVAGIGNAFQAPIGRGVPVGIDATPGVGAEQYALFAQFSKTRMLAATIGVVIWAVANAAQIAAYLTAQTPLDGLGQGSTESQKTPVQCRENRENAEISETRVWALQGSNL